MGGLTIKSLMKGCFAVFAFLASDLIQLNGQETPVAPISYRIFTPFIFNPAIAGSKDFTSVDLLISQFKRSNSQLLSGNMRISKLSREYSTSVATPEFSNIGAGAFLFNDVNDSSRSVGFGLTGSYHLNLDEDGLSFLSFGLSAKGVYHDYSGNPDLGIAGESKFFPNVDAGIYYYNASMFAGLSATNLLGTPGSDDTLSTYTMPVTRQFFLQAGYKVVLSRRLNLILEPSLIVSTDDKFSGGVKDMLKPALRIYANSFCVGTFFNDFDRLSFFFQFKYAKAYVGAYFDLPYNSPFYKDPIRAEVAAGINLSAFRWGISRVNHW